MKPPRLVNIDRNTPMLLPPDLRDWLPENHMAHFVVEAVDGLDAGRFRFNWRRSGSAQYPPKMMLSLLIYCYATGRMGSRQIEQATYYDVAVRYISADTHPDHDTICVFRRENRALFADCFVWVLALAQELGHLKKIGGVSVDGTKINANASKHAAVSYKHAGESIERLEREVEQLIAKAEEADSTPLDDGLSLPDEIARRKTRKIKLEAARKVIEARFEESRKIKQAAYDAKIQERQRRLDEGKGTRGKPPSPPPTTPEDKAQYNFTDPDSRIMKAAGGDHFEQAYNAQAVVDTEGSFLILGQRVTNHVNDKQELAEDVGTVDPAIRQIDYVLADAGFFSEEQVVEIEADAGPTVYASINKIGHRITVEDLEKHPDPPAPEADASVTDKMRQRLQTKEGKARYRLRKQTVEPVLGTIKETLGFRQFHLRGHPNVETEWALVTLAYNFKRLYNMAAAVSVDGQILTLNG